MQHENRIKNRRRTRGSLAAVPDERSVDCKPGTLSVEPATKQERLTRVAATARKYRRAVIEAIHRRSRSTYGRPRIYAELADEGIRVSSKR
jgi:hypothetical protein